MVLPNHPPHRDLGMRLTRIEDQIARLNTRDVLKNATFGADGTTVEQAFTNLNATIATANAANAAQVVPAAASGSSSSYVLTTSFATLASVTFTVPSGYTRAVVTASGAATIISNAASADEGYAQILINGSAGPQGTVGFNPSVNPNDFPSLSAFFSDVLAGLTSGGTFTVVIQARLLNGPGYSVAGFESASVTASVTFLR